MEENVFRLQKSNKAQRTKLNDENNSLINSYSQKLPLSNTISERAKNNDSSQNYTSVSISSKNKTKKKKYYITASEEEEIYYNNLFQFLDEVNSGKVDAKKVASLMKKSGISNSKLKSIWLIASQSSIVYLEKSEFYVAMRLTALAQNGLACDIESVEKNIIPPNLPKFKSFKINSNEKSGIIFKITEKFLNKSKNIFDENKNNKDNILISDSKNLLKNIYKEVNEDIIKKIITLINPYLQIKEYFNLKEFQLFSYLLSISDKYEIPNKLPTSLINFISDEKIFDEQNESSSKNCDDYLEQINIAMKKISELTSEYDSVTKKINLYKEKITFLFKEIENFEEEQKEIKQKLKHINDECATLLNYINEKKNNYLNSKNVLLNSCVYKNDKNTFMMHNPFTTKTFREKDYYMSCTTSCIFKNINLDKNLYNFDDSSEENNNSIKNNNDNKLKNKDKSDLEYYINNNRSFFDDNENSNNNKNNNKFHFQNRILKQKKYSHNTINQKLQKEKNSDKHMVIDIKKRINRKNVNSNSKENSEDCTPNEMGKKISKNNKVIKITKNYNNNNNNDSDINLSATDFRSVKNQEQENCPPENLFKITYSKFNNNDIEEFNSDSNRIKNTKTQDFKLIPSREAKHSI